MTATLLRKSWHVEKFWHSHALFLQGLDVWLCDRSGLSVILRLLFLVLTESQSSADLLPMWAGCLVIWLALTWPGAWGRKQGFLHCHAGQQPVLWFGQWTVSRQPRFPIARGFLQLVHAARRNHHVFKLYSPLWFFRALLHLKFVLFMCVILPTPLSIHMEIQAGR